MAFDIVFTTSFKKNYLGHSFVTKELIIKKIQEIDHGIFYAGEGRVEGSKVFYKKRIALESTSKRRGGRLLVILFQVIQKIYVPYAIWMANESKKQRMDQLLRSKKEREKILAKSLIHMKELLKDRP